ncbi:hypothetical protein JTE90_021961 [Oedothorax gibbosus]|uniref:Uncharacterized protein n=1 Tax=Oedothorax gibbosus TaxID=931172 RepID=A0AAV6V469_9ARAC|nr:hypothetical protein JTE90_021961 [Oedothorax gibbosus]
MFRETSNPIRANVRSNEQHFDLRNGLNDLQQYQSGMWLFLHSQDIYTVWIKVEIVMLSETPISLEGNDTMKDLLEQWPKKC